MRKHFVGLVLVLAAFLAANTSLAAPVKPGDEISPDNAALVQDLVSPGNFALVKQGMRMKIVTTERLEWPPPYKAATEKYVSQVRLNDKGELDGYLAGLPFASIDPNDPQAANKAIWNFSYRPQYTDDADLRDVEMDTYTAGASDPVEHFEVGHISFYSNFGRTEVSPTPQDPDGARAGIRYRFGAYPFMEPSEIQGFGFIRYRYLDPSIEDNSWDYSRGSGRIRRLSANVLSDMMQPQSNMVGAGASGIGGSGSGAAASFVNNLDPDSMFGFAAKIEDFNYRLLGIKPMLASVHAANVPARPCVFDNHRTICPENWEMRQLYVIEATEKPQPWHQKIGGDGLIIPRRIFYIDSEGWFITASDQYDKQGRLWKTLVTFNTYRDRPVADAKVAIFPFKRMFQTALVDEDLQDGYSTVEYTPGRESEDRECWYINMGIVTRQYLDPQRMVMNVR